MKIIQIATDSENAVYGLCEDGSLLVVHRGEWSECVDAPNQKSVTSERDTYRELCGELKEEIQYLLRVGASGLTKGDISSAERQIAKAEAILGEK